MSGLPSGDESVIDPAEYRRHTTSSIEFGTIM
jgi:hypothetical protein